MRYTLRLFFRRQQVAGIINIPKAGPLILACNHPNSFLDAIWVGVCCPRQMHFLARGDVFDKPWKRAILGAMNMIPIFRQEEGPDSLRLNKITFDRCQALLERGEIILIFSEGVCVSEKRLRPLRKGTARILQPLLAQPALADKIKVLPVGLNYYSPQTLRQEASLFFGQPIQLPPAELWAEESSKAVLAFNKTLFAALEELLLVSPAKELDTTTDALLRYAPRYPQAYDQLRHHQSLLQHLGPEHDALGKQLAAVERQHRMSAFVVSKGKATALDFAIAIFGTLLILPGLAFLAAPFGLASLVAKKKIRKVEFYDSVFLGLFFLIQHLLLLVVFISLGIGVHWLLAIVASIPILWSGHFLCNVYLESFLACRSQLFHNAALIRAHSLAKQLVSQVDKAAQQAVQFQARVLE